MRRQWFGWVSVALLGCATGEAVEVQDARVARDLGSDAQPLRPDRPLDPPTDLGPPDAALVPDAGPDAAPCEPSPEICDGLDNDCDGALDEAADAPLQRPCWAASTPPDQQGIGACVEGVQRCAGGEWGECEGAGSPRDEVCDGADQDCDGVVDEGVEGALLDQPCYDGPDDTAGQGACRRGHQTCAAGAFGPCQEQALPSEEICDGLDNDCDGQIDDVPEGSCACEPEAERDCYAGGEGTQGVGACRGGRQRCGADGLAWGPCEGEQIPQHETCNGTDDDCDGRADEAVTGTGVPCRVGAGACAGEGLTVCDADRGEVVCDAAAGAPGAETCNGADDDCDGQIDEGLGLGAACGTGEGACRAAGVLVCRAGAVACDAPPGLPAPEICDARDNDCDGQTDEGLALGEPCEAGEGACARAGTRVCRDLAATCSVEPGPADVERCNGVDDDCDGATDEGEPGAGDPCPTETEGACGLGLTVCRGGRRICQQTVQPTDEICNGVDDDCDGATDEAAGGGPLREGCYDGLDGTAGVGPCRAGERLCLDGAWAACVGQVVPAPEICDGADNDCDHLVDDVVGVDCVCDAGTEQPCYPGAAGTEGVGRCRAGQQRCRADGSGFGACVGAVVGVAELCNGVDDDCDGEIDDVPGVGEACARGVGACEAAGARRCLDGVLACDAAEGAPQAERCDGLDTDCNGVVDDVPTLGTPCQVGRGACRRDGLIACGGAADPSCDARAGAPTVETCNGVDDDCDGETDEGFAGPACTVGEGACARDGAMDCVDGVMACAVAPGAATPEACNGVDDDCDGATDEDTVGQPCAAGVGACEASGRTTCADAVGTCDAVPGAPAEERCGGGDEDCDGQTDEGLPCDPAASCEAARLAGSAADGVHLLQPPGAPEPVNVWCDQSTDGGGWTLVGSTRGTTLNDAGGAWYADLSTLAPAEGHEHLWDGLRGTARRHDVRFACRDGEAAADAPMTVDLTFRDVTWYREFTTGADAESCFSEDQGHGIDLPQPARADNVGGLSLPLGTPWSPQSAIYASGDYLEGEDRCEDTGDFTVDFDDRGMDSERSDGTDWGENDGARKCGRSGLATGQWFVFAREVRSPALACPGDDPFEENDAAEVATDVRLGPTWHGILCGADHDWFAFAAVADQCYQLDVGFAHGQGDIDVTVYAAADAAVVARGSSITDDERVVFTAPAGGGVHFDLRGWLFAAGAFNDYTLTVSSVACPTP